MKTENAIIESTMLGDGRGNLTYLIHVAFGPTGGYAQGAGGYALTHFAGLGLHLQRLLRTVGVDSWEALKGKNVRIRIEDGAIVAIGHIVKDRWISMNPEDDHE
jgi:hypothetical protein